ncbi:unnamed protein product [Ilex paraguariensis]|uniref:NAC domain-containing protein n=1 Tax=Ilex paraguariensis TaxID=185542 RepID=A0ABC8TKX9_9AQUA
MSKISAFCHLNRELCQGDPEQWFFFVPRQEREAHGGRPNRLTTIGYWKATGSPGNVYSSNQIIGVKRTMVFYRGRAPGGRKTEWKMNEYKALAGEASSSTSAAPKRPAAINLGASLSAKQGSDLLQRTTKTSSNLTQF